MLGLRLCQTNELHCPNSSACDSISELGVPSCASFQIGIHVAMRSTAEPSLALHRRLVKEVYGRRKGSVDPVYLVKRLGALGAALGEDFTDGGQHDCEEVLSAIIDRLHEDLVSPPRS